MFICKHLPIVYTAWQLLRELPRCKWRDGEGHCHNPSRKSFSDPCPFDKLLGNPVTPAIIESCADKETKVPSETCLG
jgi:hypothetical protein